MALDFSIDLTGGSSSYHRYQLVNQCILHFRDWGLIGTKDAELGLGHVGLSISTWLGRYHGAHSLDLVSGDYCVWFQISWSDAESCYWGQKTGVFIWGIGASLFANVVAFFGIGYFDQTIIAWYALLAIIAAIAVSPQGEAK